MPEVNRSDFQETVERCLVRHRSILDVLSKHQESCARVNRAVTKAVTNCGCLAVHARRQEIPDDAGFVDLRQFMATHLDGEVCEGCREILEGEIGQHLFYLAALCAVLGLRLEEIRDKERARLDALGPFSLN